MTSFSFFRSVARLAGCRLVLSLGLSLAAAQTGYAATLAGWTFETSIPATAGPFTAEIGAGLASGFHTSGATVYSSPAGNGSPRSFSSNNFSVNDYYQFRISTTGFKDVQLSWDQTSSNTGPRDFKVQYSINGSTFTDFSTYSVLPNASPNPVWNSSTSSSLYNFTRDLSGISTINNQTDLYIRLVDTSTTAANGGAVGTGGTSRVDNFTISANPVPEPSTCLLAGLGCALLGAWRVRRARGARVING